jgi:hypothetical protein
MRAHPRSLLGAKGTLASAAGERFAALFVDVSFGGVGARVAGTVEPVRLVGKVFTVDIPALVERSRGRIGMLTGAVRWARRAEDGAVEVGLRFTAASSARLRLVLSSLTESRPG